MPMSALGLILKQYLAVDLGLTVDTSTGFLRQWKSFGLPISATFKLKGVDGYRFEAPITIPVTKVHQSYSFIQI